MLLPIPCWKKPRALSIEHKQWGDAYGDLLLLARIDILQNRMAACIEKNR
jgi:hypothetical protein